LRSILAFLQDMRGPEELRAFPLWKAHQLSGGRKGTWSVYVTRNWRLTFQVKGDEIIDIDFEDYR
jgi:proteic killer suppression protein